MRALTLFIAPLLLLACGQVTRPDINNPTDALVVTAADIKTTAEAVKAACGNTVPDGPCAPGAAISTEQKNDARAQLYRAQDALEAADSLLLAGEGVAADDQLQLIEAILRELQRQLPEATP